MKTTEHKVRERRIKDGVRPVYKRVDTCAAEFATSTAYLYSTYEGSTTPSARPSRPTASKIVVLGGGPNRIGQGIEFDYCCVHAALALSDDGYETIMVNCNPETVSTDYDTSDRLYFEPVTLEDVLEIVAKEKPVGVIVQYGGQTPLKLAKSLEAAGVPIVGTSPDAIDVAEDRERFQVLIEKLGLKQPPNRTATSEKQALERAERDRLSAGRAAELRARRPRDGDRPRAARPRALHARGGQGVARLAGAARPLPQRRDRGRRRRHLRRDATSFIGGVMEHIEQAGVHSGDSACSLPPYSLSPAIVAELKRQTETMARALGVVGLMNVQFAIQKAETMEAVVYVLEVNPRASRTVPYVSKATGLQLAKIAARCMAGRSLAEQGVTVEVTPRYFSVKEAVFPFAKFPGVDTILGPEMKSTGEVMGIGTTFGEAFVKSQLAAGIRLPSPGGDDGKGPGKVFISVKNADKPKAVEVARELKAMGFPLIATRGTAAAIVAAGIACESVNKVAEGRPHIVDMVKNGDIALVINTVEEKRNAISDSRSIRTTALAQRVTQYTTIAGARAAVEGMRLMQQRGDEISVYDLQGLHRPLD